MLILKIRNVSPLGEQNCNYEWVAYINDMKIDGGVVTNHWRPHGWKALVEKVIAEKFGCHCDLDKGQEPDDCVLDANNTSECFYAEQLVKKGQSKEQCEYWKPVKKPRKAKVRLEKCHD